jgi:monoamine oxidase
MEMGATWFGNQHYNLKKVLHTLEIPFFKQHTQGISLFETMSFVPPQNLKSLMRKNLLFELKVERLR